MKTFPCRHVSATRDRDYRVSLCPGLSAGLVDDLVRAIDGRKCLLVTTPSVAGLYANGIASRLLESDVEINMLVLKCSEQAKVLAEIESLCKECFSAGLDRKSVLIGCGGGVCTDLVTMTAALARRGVSHIKIPTTLIGLIDAGIGIKGAVNLPGKKSAVGCFYPPECVFLDPSFLRTLPRHFLSDGLAEAIKVAITFDATLFHLIEQKAREILENPRNTDYGCITDLVWRSSNLLLDELETNLYEDQTYERQLDFGHTFSPMIEAESDFQISHGMSVAIDIALSSSIGLQLGLLSYVDLDRILRLLLSAGLPVYSDLLTPDRCSRSMKEVEAHRAGNLNLVVPRAIGRAVFLTEKEQIPETALRAALDFLRSRSRQHDLAALDSPFLNLGSGRQAERIPPPMPAACD